jgi:hypothetical protein
LRIRTDDYRAEPGVWAGVENAAYRSLPERPWGTSDIVTTCRRSAAHIGLDVVEETEAMRRGTMIHCAVLEPDEFQHRYVTLDPAEYPDAIHDLAGLRAWVAAQDIDIKARSLETLTSALADAGHEPPLWSTICARVADGREVIPAADYETMLRAAESVRSHPLWDELTDGDVHAELSVLAEVEGELVRARPDLVVVRDGRATIIDLKTTRDASPLGWRQSVERYGSHYQLTLQRLAVEAHGLEVDRVVWVAVETSDPHATGVYTLDPYSSQRAEADVRHAICELSRARDPLAWCGYPDTVQELHLRPWSFMEHRS